VERGHLGDRVEIAIVVQTEVSTRTTRASPDRLDRAVGAHPGEISLPAPGPGELEDAIRPYPSDKVREGAPNRR